MDEILVDFHVKKTILTLARGIDRCDRALLERCFWPDATGDYGMYKGPASEFIPWVLDLIPKSFERTQHFIGNILVEVDGDRAHSEAYFLAHHRPLGDPKDSFASGRYLDRHEFRNGEWRIADRRVVYDWSMTHPASDSEWTSPPLADLLMRGQSNRSDASYQRS